MEVKSETESEGSEGKKKKKNERFEKDDVGKN